MRAWAVVALALSLVACASPDAAPRGYEAISKPLTGDLDGDGRRDRVYVAAAERDPCDLLLVIRGSFSATRRFTVACEKPSEVGAAPPFVEALADIDAEPGLEIVVEIGHGASWRFARLFTLRRRELRPIAVEGEAEPTISYGGSVGTGERAVDCAATRGVVRFVYRTFGGGGAALSRYRMSGARLVLVGSRRLGNDSAAAAFRGRQPFPRCVRARR